MQKVLASDRTVFPKCSEMMGRAVGAVTPETTVDVVVRTMARERVGIVPVCRSEGALLGVVTDRDIAIRVCGANRRASEVLVSSIMTPDVVTCLLDDPVRRAEELMLEHQKFRILVVDELMRFAGVISLTDVLQFAAPLRAAAIGRGVTSRQFRVRPRSSPPGARNAA